MPSLKGIKAGATVYNPHVGRDITVTKVGRTYIHLANNSRAEIATGREIPLGGWYTGVNFWPSREVRTAFMKRKQSIRDTLEHLSKLDPMKAELLEELDDVLKKHKPTDGS